MEDCRIINEIAVKTPFGPPSDKITIVEVQGIMAAFLPRHGKGHRLMPSEINSRANIYALKSLGVERLIGIGATGSLREEIEPAHLVVVDQFYDKTFRRPGTFFGPGLAVHVAFDKPVCPDMTKVLSESARELNLAVHKGGLYICMEGPAFSTMAESFEHRRMNGSVIGMTAMPEVKLAREAQMCCAVLAFATDYDCWKHGEEAVNVKQIIENLKKGVGRVGQVLKLAIPRIAALERTKDCACPDALAGAIVTDPKHINKQTARKLDLLIGKYMGGNKG
ncbi:MAG: MTAP family purine nucleoside phosphorylase [Elusimicrobia bacterium]|nr:MTAP family purine nucleoside phosphorylase [Elusimicrobiota bacterium]